VSLINDALRKARQAASEHEAKQAEEVFRPRKAYPSRRTGGGGWLVTAMIAVAAAVVGASAAWLLFGARQSVPVESTIAEARPPELAGPVMVPESSPVALDHASSDETPAVGAPTPRPSEPSDPSPEPQAEVEPTAAEPLPTVAAASPARSASGEREFVMEAEIGGVVLSLGFIVARANNPFAEINGIEVYLGSEIEGFVVESIEADRVVLRDDDGQLVLRVP